jgi:hypothetical protein
MSRYLKLSQMCSNYVIVETELGPKCRQELHYSVRNKVQIDKERKLNRRNWTILVFKIAKKIFKSNLILEKNNV